MTRREGRGLPPGDLLVCFPTRARLALMPKPTYSPRRRLQYHQNHLRRSTRGGSIGGGHASPYAWPGTKQMGMGSDEPTSPRVTCAGQIKIRPSTRSCKNWQTVMEEIERLHNNRKKKTTWVEALGFKKEVIHFLSCLRRLNFDFNCFGSFSHVDITSDDEDEDEDKNDKEINQDHNGYGHDNKQDEDSSQTVFSKWFMVLQENQDCGVFEKDENSIKYKETEDPPYLPPSNALLLMRCRSAPAKSWKEEQEEERQQEKDVDDDDDDDDHHHHHHSHDHDKEDEHANKDDKLVKKESNRKSLLELMRNETEFYKLSCDIAKEAWVIGGIHKDPFSRSRSWKR